MHIRNAGGYESLSRQQQQLPLRCARRFGRTTTSHSDFKRRTSTSLRTPWRLLSWLPPLPAATTNWATSNWKRSPSPIHRYRAAESTSTTPRTVPSSLDVRTFSNLFLPPSRLRPHAAVVRCPQAQSPARPSPTRPPVFRPTSRSLRSSSRSCSSPQPVAGLSPPVRPLSFAVKSDHHPSPSPPPGPSS